MNYAALPEFVLGFKFVWHKVEAEHTFRSGRKVKRATRTCFAKLYRINGDQEVHLSTGLASYQPWCESVSKDRLRCKALALAMKTIALPKKDRIRVWRAYARTCITTVPVEIPDPIDHERAA